MFLKFKYLTVYLYKNVVLNLKNYVKLIAVRNVFGLIRIGDNDKKKKKVSFEFFSATIDLYVFLVNKFTKRV